MNNNQRIAEIEARYKEGTTQFRDVGACTLRDIRYLLSQLTESQRREMAAVEDIEKVLKDQVSQTCKVCLLYDDCHRNNAECERDAKWRGAQAGEEGK